MDEEEKRWLSVFVSIMGFGVGGGMVLLSLMEGWTLFFIGMALIGASIYHRQWHVKRFWFRKDKLNAKESK